MVLDKVVLEILFGLKLGKQLTGSCTGSQESIFGSNPATEEAALEV